MILNTINSYIILVRIFDAIFKVKLLNNLGLQNRFLCFDEMEIGKPKVKNCWPWHVPNFKELRLVPLILGRIICFQLQSKMVVLQGLKHILLIEVENKWFQPMKVGPTSKPNSLKLGTCQGWNYFTLAHQILFKCVWPPLESRYCMNKWVHL